MSGYVRIHRSLIGHPAFRNDAEAMAFAWMVAKAAYKPRRVRYKGHDIDLKRGQLTVSIRDFAEAMDRPKGWAERLFLRLRQHGMIEQKNGTQVGTQVGTHGGTVGGTPAGVVTICNYDEYQAEKQGRETPRGTAGETRARQRQDTEQVREEVKKEREPNGSHRAWLCPIGVDQQVWDDFLKNRKRKRLSNTATSWKALHDDLSRISRATGIPPPRLIEHAAAKGWAGIYDPTEKANERQPGKSASHTADAYHILNGCPE